MFACFTLKLNKLLYPLCMIHYRFTFNKHISRNITVKFLLCSEISGVRGGYNRLSVSSLDPLHAHPSCYTPWGKYVHNQSIHQPDKDNISPDSIAAFLIPFSPTLQLPGIYFASLQQEGIDFTPPLSSHNAKICN